MRDKRLRVAFYICLAVIFALFIYSRFTQKKNAPVISVGKTDVEYVEGEDWDTLLDTVTASDIEDGDITSRIVVEDVIVLKDKNKVRVTYAVSDFDNNVAKATKVIGLAKDSKAD